MSSYSHYSPDSFGGILHCLYVYTGGLRVAEDAKIGGGTVHYWNELIAVYRPGDKDNYPEFIFCGSYARCEEDQFRKRRYLKDPEVLMCFNYALQEVRKSLSFDEALAIRHVRDRLDGKWNDVTVEKETWDKMRRILRESSNGVLPKTEEDLRHVALCAVYSI